MYELYQFTKDVCLNEKSKNYFEKSKEQLKIRQKLAQFQDVLCQSPAQQPHHHHKSSSLSQA